MRESIRQSQGGQYTSRPHESSVWHEKGRYSPSSLSENPKRHIPVWNVEKLGGDTGRFGLDGSPTQVIRIFTPEPRKGGEILQGALGEQVSTLIGKLKETKLI